jgi:hypothetical protein
VLTKNLFHFVETAEAKRIRKTDQRRRRHIGLLGNRGDGIESNTVTVIKDVARNLFKTLAQRFVAATNIVLDYCSSLLPV